MLGDVVFECPPCFFKVEPELLHMFVQRIVFNVRNSGEIR